MLTAPLSSPALAAPLPFFRSSTNLPSGPASLMTNWKTSTVAQNCGISSAAFAQTDRRTKNSLLFRTMACQPSSSTSHLDKLRSLALHGCRHGIKQNLRLHVATGKDAFQTGRSWEIVANSCRETCGKSRQLKILQIRASSMEMQFGLNITSVRPGHHHLRGCNFTDQQNLTDA